MLKYLRTSDIAQAVGVHVNTVRLYETWGFLPPIPRAANGYRQFTEEHVHQMRLARLALHGEWPGPKIRQSAAALVRRAATGDLGGALELAYQHQALVQAECAQAESAAAFLERWATGTAADVTEDVLRIGHVARLLGISTDVLRNWERNGLISIPRNLRNGYRLYGAEEIGRLRVIRTLLRAGYGTMSILRMLLEFDRGNRHELRQVLDTPHPQEEVYVAFDHWSSYLDEMQARAGDMIALLSERIQNQS